MLMLLCVHVTSVLFLVLAGNSSLTMHGLLLELHALTLVACALRIMYVEVHTQSPYQTLQTQLCVAHSGWQKVEAGRAA